MRSLSPYLMFNGNAQAAMNFYSRCFGGKLEIMKYRESSDMPYDKKDADKVLHASLKCENLIIMACDDLGNDNKKPNNSIHLSIDCISESELTKYFFSLAENGEITMALHDTFWGARFGQIKDQFGINWMLTYERQ